MPAEKTGVSRSRWFESLAPAHPGSLRLFCFPYAGGSAQVFRRWQPHLPQEIVLSLVHLPGRASRINEPAFAQLTPMVGEIADAIVSEPHADFAFWGHSMGAMISFELARELRRRGHAGPVGLIVSGRSAPQIPDADPPKYDLPEQEFIAELKRLNGTPRELLDDPELMALFLPILRADFELVDKYRYEDGEPLACPFYVYGGLQDTHVPAKDLSAWQRQTTATCTVRLFPGDHFFIHSCSTGVVDALRRDTLTLMTRSVTAKRAAT
jgi:medium-chain acyl-[acyl-carrier-protein] hydrolase